MKQRIRWTKEMCREVALTCKSIKELKEKDKRVYWSASRHGWLKDYTWFEISENYNPPYTKEKIINEARKYTSYSEFRKNSLKLYEAAKRNGWLDECEWMKKIKLTREECYNEALKFGSRTELFHKNKKVYYQAWKNGWLDDYIWLVTPERDCKWSKEACRLDAMKYTKFVEYRKNSSSSYAAALKNGWLKDYTWLEKYGTQWTEEMVRNVALQFNSRVSFMRGNSGAYQAAKKNGWLDDYTWLKRPEIYNKKYYRKDVFEIAQQFDFKCDFKEKFPGEYYAALRNKWMKEMTWLKPKKMKKFDENSKNYVIYVYSDEKLNVAYIGLTNNIQQRHSAHKNNVRQSETVGMFFRKKGTPLPEPIILKEGLDVIEAQFYEGYFVEKYKNNGWKLLNKKEVGLGKSNVGGGYVKYTKEVVTELAQKFTKISEFRKCEHGAYDIARKKGWIYEFEWFEEMYKPRKYYTTEEILACSQKYEYMKDFRKNDYDIYKIAKERGLLKEMTWLKRQMEYSGPRRWTAEAIVKKSREFEDLKAFRENSPGCYQAAIKLRMLDKLTWLKRGR